jgi:hypothetical protein
MFKKVLRKIRSAFRRFKTFGRLEKYQNWKNKVKNILSLYIKDLEENRENVEK